MSSPPSYAHRYLLLSNLLETRQHREVINPNSNFTAPASLSQATRSCSLDSLLARCWRGNKNASNQDLLQHVNTLRINSDDFQLIGRLGDGQFGLVNAVVCKLDGQVYAMKTMQKHAIQRAGPQINLAIERHVHILSHLSSSAPAPKLLTAFHDSETISLVTSYAACGSLWDRLCSLSNEDDQIGCMTGLEIQWWSPQMIAAIQWLHSQGYAHRDVKPHNFLITDKAQLLLTDFGSSVTLIQPDHLSAYPYVARDECLVPIGTPDYIAPEVLVFAEAAYMACIQGEEGDEDTPKAGYDLSVDWWSLGATLFEMATGKGPFWAPTIQQTYTLLTQFQGNFRIPNGMDKKMSQLLKGYIGRSWSYVSIVNGINADVTGAPPSVLEKLQPVDLATLPMDEANLLDGTNFTFNHLFDQSTSSLLSDITPSVNLSPKKIDTATGSRWIGWTWEPPPSILGPQHSTVTPSSLRPIPVHSTDTFATPIRSQPKSNVASTVKRTVPGSQTRSRPISERQAFAELVQCVQKSAKKQLSGRRVAPSGRLRSTPNPVPPTPTPLSRDISKINDQQLNRKRRPVIRHTPLGSSTINSSLSLPSIEARHTSLDSQLEVCVILCPKM
ncbi:uncharacterized protein L201_007766 [Kwoniella dendrophila CBS 6074]|uniref:cAMP-dependent protein kinase n=1 Tax=Kwoniella dendrophila CBS 6074 TaxID=1295534 RepID=A0AAX4K587_9TREE